MHLDGFELGRSTSSNIEGGLNISNSFAKRKKKGSMYELEAIEKLKQKGYNLFSELTNDMGSSFTTGGDPFSSPSFAGRSYKPEDYT